jgi:hypothetical protein
MELVCILEVLDGEISSIRTSFLKYQTVRSARLPLAGLKESLLYKVPVLLHIGIEPEAKQDISTVAVLLYIP